MSPLARLRRAFPARPRRHVHVFRPDWLTPDHVRCWCGATPIPEPAMTEIATPEVPAGEQLDNAQAGVLNARGLLSQAHQAEQAASAAYDLARVEDPAAQSTDHARHAWAQALADWVDARVEVCRMQDELRALHQQTATYAVMEEATRG